MMIPLTEDRAGAYRAACAAERVFGSRCVTALGAYGPGGGPRFWLDGERRAALLLQDGVLTVVGDAGIDETARLVRETGAGEVDSTLEFCAALRERLGGELESSWFMAYDGPPPEGPFPGIGRAGELREVFELLRRSHPYYREHLDYDVWSRDWSRRLESSMAELYRLEVDGEAVGTGGIACEDGCAAVIAAVAVVPEYRGRGLGTRVSRFLTGRILEKGMRPMLISGYDAVAQLYRRVGFCETGKWGELYC